MKVGSYLGNHLDIGIQQQLRFADLGNSKLGMRRKSKK